MSRSFLFVPADSKRKLAKSYSSDADSIIVDLEDSVAADVRPAARVLAREFLQERGDRIVWVRINPIDTEDALIDLRSVMPARPHGIVLPKPSGADDVERLDMLLGTLEQECGIEQGATQILPIATEVPAALFQLHGYAASSDRLAGLTWGAEDLSTAVGAVTNRSESGQWLPPYELARSLCLFAAAAAEVAAIDTVFADFSDLSSLSEYAHNARRDGFSGMLAIHPAQVPLINDAFTPTEAEVARARRIVALFDEHPDTGVVGMDGEMLDRPHYVQARKILEIERNAGAVRQRAGTSNTAGKAK